MKSNCDGNILSYVCTALLITVLFAIPIVVFLASGFAVDVAGYGIKEQSDPIDVFPGLTVPDGVIAEMDIAENDVVMVSDSCYDVGLKFCTGYIPWLVYIIIILTPLSELIQYFMLRRKGEELELVGERSIFPMMVYVIVTIIGALLVGLVGMQATYASGLTLSEVLANNTIIMGFTQGVFIAVAIAAVLYFIPIIHKLFSKRKTTDLLDDDKSEFIDNEE